MCLTDPVFFLEVHPKDVLKIILNKINKQIPRPPDNEFSQNTMKQA